MRQFRSGSQILFGYLPDQTVDLEGRVWKVKNWSKPLPASVDEAMLRRELEKQAAAWEGTGRDGGYVKDLRRGMPIRVVTLNYNSGVIVEPYPNVWICKTCRRMESTDSRKCICGSRSWGQFHFVGFHDCGALREPWPVKCKEHGQVRITFPESASAAEIKLECPVCNRLLRRGLGMPECQCGNGRVTFTVHRAARVYTPRSIVVVNPPTPERTRELSEAGGPTRALQWVLGGMQTRTAKDLGRTRTAFRQQLLAQGFDLTSANQLTDQAVKLGQLADDDDSNLDIPTESREEAENEAVKIALATLESRYRVEDLIVSAPVGSELRRLYEGSYRQSFAAAGLEAAEFLDRFPVLTGNYGYTRGGSAPGDSRLVAFRDRTDGYVVYGDVAKTEALFIRLDPIRVAEWLQLRGFPIRPWTDGRTARMAILAAASIPAPGSDPPTTPTAGSTLLSLIHSYAHRFIRLAAVRAGLDRNSLSEFLVPRHLGVFIFAPARGGFVLGGLQALFETELHRVLDDVVHAEHRCALDPGCQRGGSACAACLHIGEPSCRWFNRYLERTTLHGPLGYLNRR